MAISVVMPALEMAQETGTLIAWRKQEGQAVTKGEPLLDIETDKAVVEIEAPASGTLVGILARAGAVIPVGQRIAWIVAPGEEPPMESAAPQTIARAASAPPPGRHLHRHRRRSEQRRAPGSPPRLAASPPRKAWTSPVCVAPAQTAR